MTDNKIHKVLCKFKGHDWQLNFEIYTIPARHTCIKCGAQGQRSILSLTVDDDIYPIKEIKE